MICPWCDRPSWCAYCQPEKNRVCYVVPDPSSGVNSVVRGEAPVPCKVQCATATKAMADRDAMGAANWKAIETNMRIQREQDAKIKALESELFLAREAGGELMGLIRLALNPKYEGDWDQLANEAHAKHGPKFPITPEGR